MENALEVENTPQFLCNEFFQIPHGRCHFEGNKAIWQCQTGMNEPIHLHALGSLTVLVGRHPSTRAGRPRFCLVVGYKLFSPTATYQLKSRKI